MRYIASEDSVTRHTFSKAFWYQSNNRTTTVSDTMLKMMNVAIVTVVIYGNIMNWTFMSPNCEISINLKRLEQISITPFPY